MISFIKLIYVSRRPSPYIIFIILSDNYRLPLPVVSFNPLTKPTRPTAHMHSTPAARSDKRQLPGKINCRHNTQESKDTLNVEKKRK